MQYAPGSYYARLVSGVLGLSTGNKTPQWVLGWHITHQNINGKWEPVEEGDCRMYLSLSGGAAPYTEDKLVRLGFNGDCSNPQFNSDAANAGTEIVGTPNEYNGKTSTRFDLPSGPGETEPAPDDVVRRVQAQWNQRHKAIQRPAPASNQPARTASKPAAALAMASAPTAPADDSIPF